MIDGDSPKYEVGEKVLASFQGRPYKGRIGLIAGIYFRGIYPIVHSLVWDLNSVIVRQLRLSS